MAGPMTLAAMKAIMPSSGALTAPELQDVVEALYSIDQGETVPVSGDYTWVNQGSATVTTNSRGFILLDSPSDGSGPGQMRCRVKTAPSTPYLITARFDALQTHDSEFWAGLMWRDSGDGTIVSVGTYGYDGGLVLVVGHWSSSSSYAGTQVGLDYSDAPPWFQIEDDGTDLYARFSIDGETWKTMWTDARMDLCTVNGPDQVGFFINPVNLGGTDPLGGQMLLRSWKPS